MSEVDADLIIVDEMSMIDIELMVRLLDIFATITMPCIAYMSAHTIIGITGKNYVMSTPKSPIDKQIMIYRFKHFMIYRYNLPIFLIKCPCRLS